MLSLLLSYSKTESRFNMRLCYFCIKRFVGIIVNTEVYVPKWSDFYLTQKKEITTAFTQNKTAK